MIRRHIRYAGQTKTAAAALALASAALALAAIALAVICTPVTSQDEFSEMAPSILMTGVVASGEDEHIEIVSNQKDTENLRGWVLEVDGAEAALPLHLLEPGGFVRVHPGAGRSNQTDLYLESTIRLNDTAGRVVLKDEMGAEVASLKYEMQPDGSTVYETSARADFWYPSSRQQSTKIPRTIS
ncbi:MAG: hypothetical protein A4E45_01422 [Methanosaeta sp. PtaB.Bin039]|nr:MAG: hypothetical protein A4E45_01422 [Methanosaeta sp. PtaB.Bin039]